MNKLGTYLNRSVSAAPLAVFRIVLGLMLLVSIVRFWMKGWIHDFYLVPKYFFTYYGFDFVKPLGNYTYGLFFFCALCALLVALGWLYRYAIVGLFLSFTYIELIDKTTYLNHYYFISMICLLMIFLPANRYFALDAYKNPKLFSKELPNWSSLSLKCFVTLLYCYAGLAKLNSDWLLHAQPLRIWLPSRNDLPLIGHLFNYPWVAYAFSWIGCIYDLSIAFLLWNSRSRLWAYLAVVVFHILTAVLFPIGMFPYFMMGTALVFFSAKFHQNIIDLLVKIGSLPQNLIASKQTYQTTPFVKGITFGFLVLFFGVQLLLPLRYLCYPGELFWTEQGYRFSWRVMLMEKSGYAQFTVKGANGKIQIVNNSEFLTPLQEKMMATQPDMILQYAHFLSDYYRQHGFYNPQVFVDAYVNLNGRLGKLLIDPTIDLAKQKESFAAKTWILPLNDEIKGL